MAEQTWQEWVESFNAPQGAAIGGAAVLPQATTGGLAQANLNNIQSIFDPRFGMQEAQTLANENAIAGGWGGGGFAGGQALKLLDSERKANFLLGSQMLEPYLQRESAAGLQASDNASRLNQIAAEGAQSLQRLQLSEAGQTARLSSEQASALERSVLAGQQAMQQLTIRESGETGRQNTSIQGQLAGQLLGATLTRSNAAASASGPDRSRDGYRDWSQGGAWVSTAPPPSPRGGDVLGLGSSSIDQLLKKYGLIA